MKSYRLVIAHENEMLYRSIRRMLGQLPGTVIVGHTMHLSQLPELIKTETPDGVVVGFFSSNHCAGRIIDTLRQMSPELKIVVLFNDATEMDAAFQAGADAYLLHQDLNIELFSAIKITQSGTRYISSQIQS
ncbi:MAG: response regulator transcription factor [Desulfobacteraceae bacterium]|nr:response regulator transcription factor [Desulfobacteraceae bacterium]